MFYLVRRSGYKVLCQHYEALRITVTWRLRFISCPPTAIDQPKDPRYLKLFLVQRHGFQRSGVGGRIARRASRQLGRNVRLCCEAHRRGCAKRLARLARYAFVVGKPVQPSHFFSVSLATNDAEAVANWYNYTLKVLSTATSSIIFITLATTSSNIVPTSATRPQRSLLGASWSASSTCRRPAASRQRCRSCSYTARRTEICTTPCRWSRPAPCCTPRCPARRRALFFPTMRGRTSSARPCRCNTRRRCRAARAIRWRRGMRKTGSSKFIFGRDYGEFKQLFLVREVGQVRWGGRGGSPKSLARLWFPFWPFWRQEVERIVACR